MHKPIPNQSGSCTLCREFHSVTVAVCSVTPKFSLNCGSSKDATWTDQCLDRRISWIQLKYQPCVKADTQMIRNDTIIVIYSHLLSLRLLMSPAMSSLSVEYIFDLKL